MLNDSYKKGGIMKYKNTLKFSNTNEIKELIEIINNKKTKKEIELNEDKVLFDIGGSDRKLELICLEVADEYQRQGIGKEAIKIILSTIEEYGYFEEIEIKSSEESKGFYYKIEGLELDNNSTIGFKTFYYKFPKNKFNSFKRILKTIIGIDKAININKMEELNMSNNNETINSIINKIKYFSILNIVVSIIIFLILEPYNNKKIFGDIIEIIKIIVLICLILEIFKKFIKCSWTNININIIKEYIVKLFNYLGLKEILFYFLILFLLNYAGDYKNENTFMKINFIVSCIIYFIINYIISLIIKLKNWAFEENVENRLNLIKSISLEIITRIYTFFKSLMLK